MGTECHGLDGFNEQHLFLTVFATGKTQIKSLTDLVSDKSYLFGMQMATF